MTRQVSDLDVVLAEYVEHPWELVGHDCMVPMGLSHVRSTVCRRLGLPFAEIVRQVATLRGSAAPFLPKPVERSSFSRIISPYKYLGRYLGRGTYRPSTRNYSASHLIVD